MEERTWTYLDRSKWPRGEWDNEPDKIQWQDKVTGLPCLIVRNQGGALCGYVGVSQGHPYFQRDYDDCRVDVHGGLTFADFCQPYGKNNEQGICHVVDKSENDRVWWLGFDCAHYRDVTPAYDWSSDDYESSYKDVRYVQSEVFHLAAQLAEVANAPEAGSGDNND